MCSDCGCIVHSQASDLQRSFAAHTRKCKKTGLSSVVTLECPHCNATLCTNGEHHPEKRFEFHQKECSKKRKRSDDDDYYYCGKCGTSLSDKKKGEHDKVCRNPAGKRNFRRSKDLPGEYQGPLNYSRKDFLLPAPPQHALSSSSSASSDSGTN